MVYDRAASGRSQDVYKRQMLRLATVKGQISSADGVRKISVSAVLPEDITGVTVRAVLLSDFITMTPLARCV